MITHETTWHRCWSGERKRIERWFFSLASGILAGTGLLKLASVFESWTALARPDPLFLFLSTRTVLLAAVVLELVVACILLVGRNPLFLSAWLTWLCLVLATYRFSLHTIGYRGPCKCLGNPPRWLPLDSTTLDRIALTLLIFMASGGMAILIWHVAPAVIASKAERNPGTARSTSLPGVNP